MDQHDQKFGGFVFFQLSAMMFLQFFIWGAWYTTIAVYMTSEGMETLTHWPFTVNPIAAAIEQLEDLGLTVLVLYPESLDEVYGDIRLLGGVGNAMAAPHQLAQADHGAVAPHAIEGIGTECGVARHGTRFHKRGWSPQLATKRLTKPRHRPGLARHGAVRAGRGVRQESLHEPKDGRFYRCRYASIRPWRMRIISIRSPRSRK